MAGAGGGAGGPGDKPVAMPVYGKTEYWDTRYTEDPEPFDWYQRYSGIAHFVHKYVKRDDAVLVAGCGNSRLSEDMVDDGYRAGIIGVDISSVVVQQMQARYRGDKAREHLLEFQHMNACALEFPDETFDAVIAKALVDVVMCGEGHLENVANMCMEVSRVLRPNGIFMIISYRDDYFEVLDPESANKDFGWKVEPLQVNKPTTRPNRPPTDEKGNLLLHHVYICRKAGGADEG